MGFVKQILKYSILVIILIFLHNFLTSRFLEPIFPQYKDYKNYTNAGILFLFGWMAIREISNSLYKFFIEKGDKSTAGVIKTLTTISGFFILLVLISTLFNLGSSTSLIFGSFFGLIIGFGTQTVVKNMIAGILILVLKPIKIGDRIKIGSYEGIVKEIELMHIVIKGEEAEYLIPSSKLFSDIIMVFKK